MKWLWRPADDLLLARRVLVPPVGAPVLTVQLKKYLLDITSVFIIPAAEKNPF